MKTGFIWIMTLFAGVAVAASGAYCFRGLDHFFMTAAKVRVLETEVKSLEHAIEQTRYKQEEVAEWKALLGAASEAGLRQEQWRTYPVSVSRELTWEELSMLVLIASNGKPRGDEYWFQPELLRVVRVVSSAEEKGEEDQSGEAPSEMYRVRLKGDFLISTP